jgi:hypothetical protein
VPVKSVRKRSFVKAGKPTGNGLLLGDARAEGRIGGRRPKLNSARRADIAQNVMSGGTPQRAPLQG